MMAKKWITAAALLAISTVALADDTYQYQSITKVDSSGRFYGVLVGDTVPTTLNVSASSCREWVELMFKNPGKYLLSVTITTYGFPPITTNNNCVIELAP